MAQQRVDGVTGRSDRDSAEAAERMREWGATAPPAPLEVRGSGPVSMPRSQDVTRLERPDIHVVVEISMDDIADADDVRP